MRVRGERPSPKIHDWEPQRRKISKSNFRTVHAVRRIERSTKRTDEQNLTEKLQIGRITKMIHDSSRRDGKHHESDEWVPSLGFSVTVKQMFSNITHN